MKTPAPARAAQRIGLSLTLLALLCSLAALVGGTLLFVRQTEATLAQIARQAEMSVRLRELQGVLVNLADAETGQRGYLLTGHERYLQPYRRATATLPGLLKALDRIQVPGASLKDTVGQIQHLIGLKLVELARTIELHDAGQPAAALALVVSGAGQTYTDQARAAVNAVLEQVRNERDRLSLQIAAGEAQSQDLLVLTVSLFVLFTALAGSLTFISLRGRTRSERALALSEQQHRAILEAQSELVSQSREDGTLTYVNPAYARYFGYQPHELLGRSLYDHVEPKDRGDVKTHLSSVLATGEVRESENRMLVADGRERWIAWTNRRQMGPGGEYLLHSVGRDFTERKALEQRLADNERFVHQITDNLPVRIAYLDRELRYRFVNLAHCARFGKSRSEILGRTRAELTGGQSDERVLPHVQAVLAGQPQRFEFDEQVNGAVRRIESQLIPDIADSGDIRGIYSTGLDITERAMAERSVHELTEIIEYTSDFVVQTDWRGAVQYLNPAARRAMGLAPDAPLEGFNFQDFNTPETNEKFATEIVSSVKALGLWVGEATVYAEGRRVVPVSDLVIGHRDANGRVARYSAVMRDMSDEKDARDRLALQAATLQAVIEAIPAIVAVVGADRRYRFVNQALERWLGLPRQALVGQTMAQALGATEYARNLIWVDRVLAGETVSFEKDFPNHDPPVHFTVTYIPLQVGRAAVDGFVIVAQDISQHRQEAVRLLKLSERDPLTGLMNRAGFDSYLKQAVKAGEAASLALLYIDLDHFKPINDQHGHPVGDQLLCQFGRRLRGLIRPTDAVARLGGDEFAVVLSGVRAQANGEAVADKILDAAHAPFTVEALRLQVGASIGIAFDASDAQGLEGLIARADKKLYEAKAAGRGRRV